MKEKWIDILFNQAFKRSLMKQCRFDITKDYLEALWRSGSGKCVLTGIEFFDGGDLKEGDRRPFIPSLDRIDNRKGYVRGNVRIVCYAVNVAMLTWGLDVFDYVVKQRKAFLDGKKSSGSEFQHLSHFECMLPNESLLALGIQNKNTINTKFAAIYLTKVHGIPTAKSSLEVYRCQSRGPKYKKIGSRAYYTADWLDEWAKGVAVKIYDPSIAQKSDAITIS